MAVRIFPSRVHSFPIDKYALQQEVRPHKCSHRRVVCATRSTEQPVVVRRSGNYKPNVWDYNYLMSLGSKSTTNSNYKTKAEELKEKVRYLLTIAAVGSVEIEKLDLVDAIERLGLGYHFMTEIKSVLETVMNNQNNWSYGLYTTSLGFRLLRQHGCHIPQSVFDKFRDDSGCLKKFLVEDAKGLLSLYEASYLGLEGEHFLDETKAFATMQLETLNLKRNTNPTLAKKISHSLELPLHWRTSILEARWYIDTYGSEENMLPILLDLAKLDFNMAQNIYQSEVRILTRWWVDLGLRQMDFSRDRLLEHYYWALGGLSEPQFGRARIELAKVGSLITHIDDIYDVYGSLDELILFTDAVERWETSAMEQLPQYMKITYMALLHTCNDIGFAMLKETGYDVTSNLKNGWVDLCKSYLLEAKWYHSGQIPPFEEYLENGLVSIATPLVLLYCYFLTTEVITKEAFNYIEGLPSLIHASAVLFRLVDDLGTSSEEVARGDVPKSIQCYMSEASVTEEVARNHVNQLVHETWKKMNKAQLSPHPLSDTFIFSTAHLARQAHCVYQFGDGHGSNNHKESKERLKSLLVEPIPIVI